MPIEAIKAHAKLPLAKRVVAAVSAYPVGGKKVTSAKAVKEVSMLKEVRSMTGGRDDGGVQQEHL
jgi:hypothetical protein